MTFWEDIISNALGSAGAGIFSRLLTHPLDTIKARRQAAGHRYSGPLDVFRKTYSIEGVKGFYRGLGAVIIGGTPGTIIYLCSYDIFKARIASLQRTEEKDSFGVHFASGLLAEGTSSHC